ncbi:MAG TPA: hypothetical protein VEW03_12450 [Longimicrobiaceae bacterium]|nr:hypothetical protein [Longimicrobiaceae bacterium]
MTTRTTAELPVACALPPADLEERRAGALGALAAAVLERRELPDGWALRFAPEAGRVPELARVVELERACCAFLRFRLTVEPAQGPVWLELTGPPGAKELLAELLTP